MTPEEFAYLEELNTLKEGEDELDGLIYLLECAPPAERAEATLRWYFEDHIDKADVAFLSYVFGLEIPPL